MTDYAIRVVEPEEYRAAHTVFRGTLHAGPAPDDAWERVRPGYEPDRTFGAFRDSELVGTAQSFSSRIWVPGGQVLPMAMVSRVGVRADHTRRGLLTGLMRAQLGSLTEPIATLRASEGTIYGRFGYSVASRMRSVRITKARAVFRPDAPTGGQVRVLRFPDVVDSLPAMYERIAPTRPGWASRESFWWKSTNLQYTQNDAHVLVAIHTGPDGDDGYAIYRVSRDDWHDPEAKTVLELSELMTETEDAWAGLWRFLLGVDLVTHVNAFGRPLDEPLEWLFTDRRAVRTDGVGDETWLRIVDVPTALAARGFGLLAGPDSTDSLVLEVRDPFLPANSGTYRIGREPAHRVAEPADLVLDVDVLGALYLGDVAPSALAGAGRLTVREPAVLPVADRLFAVDSTPWCGTFF